MLIIEIGLGVLVGAILVFIAQFLWCFIVDIFGL